MYIKYDEFIKEKWFFNKNKLSTPEIKIDIDTPEYYSITKYTKNDDGSIDINQSARIYQMKLPGLYDRVLKKIPFKIRNMYGDLDCSFNSFTTLDNSPINVYGNFNLRGNEISDTTFAPRYVKGCFNLISNNINNIEDYPMTIVDGDIIFRAINDFDDDEFGDITSKIKSIINNNKDIFENLLDNKIKFHQMVMTIDPSLIKYYKTIPPPPSKKTNLLI